MIVFDKHTVNDWVAFVPNYSEVLCIVLGMFVRHQGYCGTEYALYLFIVHAGAKWFACEIYSGCSTVVAFAMHTLQFIPYCSHVAQCHTYPGTGPCIY